MELWLHRSALVAQTRLKSHRSGRARPNRGVMMVKLSRPLQCRSIGAIDDHRVVSGDCIATTVRVI